MYPRGIAIRDELTSEWKKRGVKEQLEFAILNRSHATPRRRNGRQKQKACGLNKKTVFRFQDSRRVVAPSREQ
jgi:hypothetical protein